MRKKRYKLEILWENGVLTETTITETERELIERHGKLYLITRYWLEGDPEVKPYSFQVWDEEDHALFPATPEAVPA